MGLNTLGIIGAGQMGSGIAQVAAQSGLSIILNDISDEMVRRAQQASRDFSNISYTVGSAEKLPSEDNVLPRCSRSNLFTITRIRAEHWMSSSA